MQPRLFLLFLLLFCSLFGFKEDGVRAFKIKGEAQGTTYHITYYAKDSVVTVAEIETLFAKIDSSLSIYRPYTTISRFNGATKGTKIDAHLKNVVKKSIEVYTESNGIFDITVYPIVKAWGFADKKITHLPDSAAIKKLLPCIGTEKLILRKDSLLKTDSCVKIDVNGIAQGYTVDYIANELEKKGIKTYLVEVGGELRTKGKKPDGQYMQIGIEAPAEFSYQEPVINKIITLKEGAVTTSGNYRKYVESNGTRIAHLMNPKTGFPITTSTISVTVIAKDAFTADAYDNVLMGMDIKKALDFLKKKKGMHAYFIYRDSKGLVKDTLSAGFRQYVKE